MKLNESEYFYIRNGQGDITGLFDSSGTQVVSYSYDSWGRFINADEITGVTGELHSHNMFAYCKNDHINETDSTGFIVDTIFDIISSGIKSLS